MKYIIKNCPAYSDFCKEIKSYECQNIENCLLKQIVEICSIYRNIKGVQLVDYAKKEVALKILDKLEIEEE